MKDSLVCTDRFAAWLETEGLSPGTPLPRQQGCRFQHRENTVRKDKCFRKAIKSTLGYTDFATRS